MTTADLDKAFSLSAELVEYASYPKMTSMFLSYVQQLQGVDDVISYEVFGDVAKRSGQAEYAKDFLVRRFPLTLDEEIDETNAELIEQAIKLEHGGIHQIEHQNSSWLCLDITDGVVPRRLILIKGELNSYDRQLVSGLFRVYASLVLLLDRKERDELTRLLNRHSFDFLLDQVLDYYRTHEVGDGKYSWMAILDVDNFKTINDTNGHLYGDEVLLHFAGLLESTFRYSDFLFRFGGDEFVVILNRTDLKGARASLERFRSNVESYPFPGQKVTTSIGFTRIDSTKSQASLIDEADKALYLAKEKGRNNVQQYSGQGEDICAGDVELF